MAKGLLKNFLRHLTERRLSHQTDRSFTLPDDPYHKAMEEKLTKKRKLSSLAESTNYRQAAAEDKIPAISSSSGARAL